VKKCSTFLTIKEMLIKSKLRLHITPVRTQTMTNAGNNVGKEKPSYTVSESIKWYYYHENSH
jgi:hypothetical protein